MVQGADDGVVERGAAASVDALQRFLEFGNAVSKILVEIEVQIVVEIDDKGFVLGIAVQDESKRGLVHLRPFVAHAAAIVNDQAHADGNIFALEEGELLLGLVLVNAETVLRESFHEFAAIVDNGGMEHDQTDIQLDAAARLPLGGILVRGRRRRDRLHGNLRPQRASKEKQGQRQSEACKKYRARVETGFSGQARSNRSWSKRKEGEGPWV